MNNNHSHIRFIRKTVLVIILFLIIFSGSLLAQPDRKFIRKGNREYSKENFSDSEILYRRALDKNRESGDAMFNAGDALYKQKKYEDAGKEFIQSTNINENKDKKSVSLYNLGNSLLMANKLQESIEAYKNSLKLKPDNMEAKYNLAYAQDLLRKQQQEQQQEKNNKDQKKDQEKDQQKDSNQDNKNQDQNKENQQDLKNDQQQQQQQNAQQQEQSMSREDAERLLNSIANDEKKVQEKVKLAKASKDRVRTLKNW